MAFPIRAALRSAGRFAMSNPTTMLWYRKLRQPAFKPPDAAVPVVWTTIELALATAAYRLMRLPQSAASGRALALLGWNVFTIGGWSRLFAWFFAAYSFANDWIHGAQGGPIRRKLNA